MAKANSPGDEIDESGLDHELAAGADHRPAEQKLSADGAPTFVEHLGSRVVLDQGIEPSFDDGDGRRRREIGVEGLLESFGDIGGGAGQHHQRRCGHGRPGGGPVG